MLVHLDTSLLVDAFTGRHRSLGALRSATASGDALTFSTIVLYEWLRGPRTGAELRAVEAVFANAILPEFDTVCAARAADLHRTARRARQRQADLAIAACALEHGAAFWTLNPADFEDIAGLTLYRGSNRASRV